MGLSNMVNQSRPNIVGGPLYNIETVVGAISEEEVAITRTTSTKAGKHECNEKIPIVEEQGNYGREEVGKTGSGGTCSVH